MSLMDEELLEQARIDEKRLILYTELDYVKPLNTDIFYVQDWFTKASWKEKLDFCTTLFKAIKGKSFLLELVYLIGTPGKDIAYTKEQYTKSSYDIRPLDHNRCLTNLESIKRYYLNWFKLLENHQQFLVFAGILETAGSAIQQKIYEMGRKILAEKEDMLALQLQHEKLIEERLKMNEKNKTSSKRKIPLSKHRKSIVRKMSKQATKVCSETSIVSQTALLDMVRSGRIEQLFLGPRVDHKARAELNKLQLQWKKCLSRNEIPELKTQNVSCPDKIQMLPIWINRKIINELPESSYNSLSKVNGYWKDMINNVRKEYKTRRMINFAILSIEASAPVYRMSFAEEEQGKKKKSLNKRIKRPSSLPITNRGRHTIHSLRKTKRKSAVSVSFLMPEERIKRTKLSNFYNNFGKKLHFKNYQLSVISKEYAFCRNGVASSRWIIYSNDNKLKFHCTTTGAPSTIEIEDFRDEPITCLALHPNNYQVIAASYNGQIKLYDIWRRECKLTYTGNDQVVVSIAANKKYLVSCSVDSVFKIYRIENAVCILSMVLDGTPTKLRIDEESSVYVGNTNGKLLMIHFVDPGTSLSKKDVFFGMIPRAHFGEITSLSLYPLLVVSGGVDGYARIWDADMSDPHWIGSFKHKTRVNSAIISFLKLFTAAEDGFILIWDITSGDVIQKICINQNGRPVLNMFCLEGKDSVKFILFSELDIKLIEFELPWNPKRKTLAKTHERMKIVGRNPEKMTKTDLDLLKLHYRQAILEQIRTQKLMKGVEEQKPTVYSISANEIDNIESFPRVFPTERIKKANTKRNYKNKTVSSFEGNVQAETARTCM